MAQWAVIIPAEQWATERLFHSDTVTVAGASGIGEPVIVSVALSVEEANVLPTLRVAAPPAFRIAVTANVEAEPLLGSPQLTVRTWKSKRPMSV